MPLRYGTRPFDLQLRFFLGKVNVPTERWADVWREAHDSSFMVAGAMKADLLQDLRGAVEKAIGEGTTLAEFRRDFDQIVARHGWSYRGERGWRTRTIYETNLRASYQAGRWAQVQAVQGTRPYLLYRHSDSVTTPRPLHLAWDGLAIPADDPWWSTHWPPNGWGCKCRAFAVSDRDLERLGKSGPDAPPDNGTYQWTDRVTGEVHTLPAGIDPGWDYAAGATRTDLLARQVQRKASSLPPALGGQLREEVRQPPPAPPPPRGPASAIFSTVRGVDAEGLERVVEQVPGAGPQLEKVRRFLDAHPVKTLVLKQSEMGQGRTGRALAERVAEFLGRPPTTAWYTVARGVGRTNGFTHRAFDHVTVKAGARDRLSNVRPDELAAAVERAIAGHGTGQPVWSIRQALESLTGGTRPGLVTTWIHELGHQVHYWAGMPSRPGGLSAPGLTQYSRVNGAEWHAEHFAAWFFNRGALAAWSPEVAAYFDELVERAIRATEKGV